VGWKEASVLHWLVTYEKISRETIAREETVALGGINQEKGITSVGHRKGDLRNNFLELARRKKSGDCVRGEGGEKGGNGRFIHGARARECERK